MPIKICLVKATEKAMAPHSNTPAWKIPWTEEPGRLQSMGSLRVGYDWATSLSLFTFMHWRRKWQPTPLFLPGESQGRGSLLGCHLWGRTVRHDWSDLAAAAVKAMVFPVVMYGCESWTVKKAERRRIDAFECGVGEDSWESLGLQGDPTSPF